jgi:hypothetical protein
MARRPQTWRFPSRNFCEKLIEALKHLISSPDLHPCDFILFPPWRFLSRDHIRNHGRDLEGYDGHRKQLAEEWLLEVFKQLETMIEFMHSYRKNYCGHQLHFRITFKTCCLRVNSRYLSDLVSFSRSTGLHGVIFNFASCCVLVNQTDVDPSQYGSRTKYLEKWKFSNKVFC